MKTPAPHSPVQIRRLRLEDLGEVRALWKICGLSEEPEDGDDSMAEFLGAPQSAGFVALADARIVGAVLCGNDGRYGYLHHLGVDPGHRRRNIGRALIDACNQHLSTLHVAILVRGANVGGLSFWREMGYTRVDGLEAHFIRRPGA